MSMFFGFEHITVAYGKHTVLNDVTLEVPQGRICVLIGRNGCGKSSLLRTVSRAVKPKSGRVIWQDRPLDEYSPRQRARGIAYLGQSVSSPADIDVETLVSYGRYPHMSAGRGMTAHDRKVIEHALMQAGLDAIRNRALNTLSGGELQRARIAMNLAQEPSILILDEPTTHLDIGYQLEIMELLRKLNRELGLTVLMVLHDVDLAARYADRICGICDGRLDVAGTPEGVITVENMRRLFGIESEILWDETNGCPYVRPRTYTNEENE